MGHYPQHWYRGRPTAESDHLSLLHVGGNLLNSGHASLGDYDYSDPVRWFEGTGNMDIGRSSFETWVTEKTLSVLVNTSATQILVPRSYPSANLTPGGPTISGTDRYQTYPILGPSIGVTLVEFGNVSRSTRTGLRWFDATGTVISDSVGSDTTNLTNGWDVFRHTATPPAAAVSYCPIVQWDSASAGDIHYIGLVHSSGSRFGGWNGPRSILKEITVANETGVTATVTVGVRPPTTINIFSGTTDGSEVLFRDLAVAPKSIVAFSLNTVIDYGDYLWARQATAGALTVNVSGVHIY